MSDTPPATAETVRQALEREHREIDHELEQAVATDDADAASGHVRRAVGALRRHIYLEEVLLFPPLRAAGLLAPLLVMLNEHGELWRETDQLDLQLTGGAPLAQLQETATVLLAQLDAHNTKEEPIIYPKADVVLSTDAAAELQDFLAHEELPDGWTCDLR